MHSTLTSNRSYIVNSYADKAQFDSARADELVEQVMSQALNELSSLTGLGQRQVLQLLANKYNIPVEHNQHSNVTQLLNDEESVFIGKLFN